MPAPDPNTVVDDPTLASYVITLWFAWADCATQLAAVGSVR